MSTATLTDLIDERTRLMPWTVQQYHRMIRTGIVPEGEPYELLNGQLVRKDRSAAGEDPMTVGHEHTWVVEELAELNAKLRKMGCYLRSQQPISIAPMNEPEPDAAIVIGSRQRYRKRKPAPDDVLCVIEVADASLRRDRTVKQQIYADAGIGRYIIINLVDRIAEVYTQPIIGEGRYRAVDELTPRRVLRLPTGSSRQLPITVSRLMPG